MIQSDEFLEFCEENHLNVTEDDSQWLAVNSDKNTVVSAGAGTGKTTVLSFRFLRLVAEKKAKPSEILTITFTRKATAEMKERIYLLMQKAYKKNLIEGEDLKDFSNCTISTVDSFCTEVVRKNSVSMGISRDFGMLSDDDLALVSDDIVSSLLHEMTETSSYLLNSLSVSQIKQIFLDLAKEKLNIVKPIDVNKSLASLKTFLDSKKEELANQVKRDIDYVISDLKLDQDKIEAIKRIYLLVDTCTGETSTKLQENWKIISRVKKDEGLKDKIKDKIQTTIPACIQGLLDLDKEKMILEMAVEFEKRLVAYKRQKGLLTFSDIMQLSLKILTDDLEQRRTYSNAFKYVMIDEFQDNNDDYRKLLFLLCGKPELQVKGHIPTEDELEDSKIFLVGDQKQSIYRFRGAEVSVFKSLSEKLCEKPIELTKNWRSEPQIINFCNHIFSILMSNSENKSYEADFSFLDTRDSLMEGPIIELIVPKEDTSIKQEALLTALKIKEIVSGEANCTVIDKNGNENCPKYSDIALLFRSTSNQKEYEQALNYLGIPYSVSEARTLPKEAIACDFYSALMTVVNPYDMCAYASLLKSPFFDIGDWYIKEATEKDIAGPFVEGLSKIIKEEGLLSALIWLWNNQGYRSYIDSYPGNRSYSQHFDWLYSIAADLDAQGKGVVEFTDLLRDFSQNDGKKLPQEAVFEEETQGVQIMTIHKSKGLAFEVVFVCDMDFRMPLGSFKSHNITIGDGLSMRYAKFDDEIKNPVAIINKDLEQDMENAELKRVFYVALTRAKSHLFMTAKSLDVSNSHTNKSMLSYLVNRFGIKESVDNPWIYSKDFNFFITQKDVSVIKEQEQRQKPDVAITTPTYPKAIDKVPVTSLENDDISEDSIPLRDIKSDEILQKHSVFSNFGTRVHSLIELAISNKTEQDNPKDFYPKDLSDREVEILENDSRELADNFLNSDYLKQMKEKDYEFFCEKPLVLFMEEENKVAEGRIDLLCVSKDRVEIVDFKTDRFKSPQRHKVQLELYKKAIESMPEFKDRIIETNVVYLREKMK